MSDHFFTEREANVVAQIWIAFGRGAGTEVAASAVDAMTRLYSGRLGQIVELWPRQAKEIIDASEMIGRQSAAVACLDGRFVVEAIDVMDDRVSVICPCSGP